MNDKLASNDPLIQKLKITFETLDKITSEIVKDELVLIPEGQIETFDLDNLLSGWDELLTILEDTSKLTVPISDELKRESELRIFTKDKSSYDIGCTYRQIDMMLLAQDMILEDIVHLKITREFNYLVLVSKNTAIKLVNRIYHSIIKSKNCEDMYTSFVMNKVLNHIEHGDAFKDNSSEFLVLIQSWFETKHNQKK